MATFQEIADVMNQSMLEAMVAYSGGKVKTPKRPGVKRAKGTTNEAAILKDHFRSGNESRYTELSPKYKKYKQRKVGDKPILVFTSNMENSLLGQAVIQKLGKDGFLMTFPQAVLYTKFHASGTETMPQRHPTALTVKDQARFDKALQDKMAVNISSLDKGQTRSPRRT